MKMSTGIVPPLKSNTNQDLLHKDFCCRFATICVILGIMDIIKTCESGLTTRRIMAMIPITVAEYRDEDGHWHIEGIDYPVTLVANTRATGERALCTSAQMAWEYCVEMMCAMNKDAA